MSEVKAIVLTDVVDSTQLARQIGDVAIAAVWGEHDRVTRDLLPLYRGREIDKTDGMLMIFDDVEDAARFALHYQAGLAAMRLPLRARVGLHVGPVVLRENSAADVALGAKPLEVDGAAKAIAARVMSVALGGQILVSGPSLQALELARTWQVQSHGHWRLKGVDEPLELFELREPGLSGASFLPPPDSDKAYRVVPRGELWLPVREIRHSLPAERDAFIGRDLTLSEVARQLQGGARLLSVTGPGGTGKTRLVTRFGWAWLGEFPGGVWFCDLSAARSPEGVVHAVAQGLGMALGAEDPVVQIGNAIAGRGACLVILDNFEQVALYAAETLGRWLDRAPQARFVDTSREVLGLPGERVLSLHALPADEAVKLFKDRAEAAASGFASDPADEAAILPLVTMLEGLPLAIELAAARSRVMSPRLLLQRMGERFKLLALPGQRKDRQATLRATLDWSWELLQPALQAALAQLSVFERGFTLDSAEAVIDAGGFDDAPWAVDIVTSLVDKSLVRRLGGDRFDLLVTVQLYADEQLRTQGRFAGSGAQALAAAQRRHASWFAGLGPVRASGGRCVELDNLVVACRRAVALGEPELAVGTLDCACAALGRMGPYAVSVALGESVCAMPGLQGGLAASARVQLARDQMNCRRLDLARPLLEEAALLAQVDGDERLHARLSAITAQLLMREGKRDAAFAEATNTVKLGRQAQQPRLECRGLLLLAVCHNWAGRLDDAERAFLEALALAARPDCLDMRGGILHSLSALHSQRGRPDEELACLEEALTLANDSDDRLGQVDALGSLAWSYYLRGRYAEALATAIAAKAAARELGALQKENTSLCNIAIIREALGQSDQSLLDFGAAVATAQELGDKNYEGQFLAYFALLHARQGRHDQATECLERGEALLRETSDPFSLAILQCSRAEARHRAGDAQAAGLALAAAEAAAVELGAGETSELGISLARVRGLAPTA
ncbi:MAG: ATP-binding protein [Aquabacterium sp.]